MNDKNSAFEFHQVDVGTFKRLLRSLPDVKSAGTDHLDIKLLRISASHVSTPICYIFNRCVMWCVSDSWFTSSDRLWVQ